jgi:hypothetical protein
VKRIPRSGENPGYVGAMAGLRAGRLGLGNRGREGRLEAQARELEERARQTERRPGLRRLARIGLFARTVVYGLIGGLILKLAASGASSTNVDTEGALSEIVRQPGGSLLLGALALCLAAYSAWRVVQAVAGESAGGHQSAWVRAGWLASGLVYVGLCMEAIALIVGSPTSGGPVDHPRPLVADVLGWPLGPGLVALAGAGVIAAGAGLMAWGVLHRYDKVLDAPHMSRAALRLARASGMAGDSARGLVIALFGVYLLYSALTDDPAHAKSVSTALDSLVGVPGGPVLVGVVGGGFLAFAAYSLFEVRFRRIGAAG